ncbi:MAG: hypothetical protein ACYTFQ_27180 [Planctomycetota bacterium]|jgi:hypothetical protein
MALTEIPSLSRLLDTKLTVEVVEGEVTSMHNMETITISIPTADFNHLSGHDVEFGYLRPMIKALAEKINSLGDVKARALPLPEKETAWLCTQGKIPVMLRIVRREKPDRHQLLIHALVQPVDPKPADANVLKQMMDDELAKLGVEVLSCEGEPEMELRYITFDLPKGEENWLAQGFLYPAVHSLVCEIVRHAPDKKIHTTHYLDEDPKMPKHGKVEQVESQVPIQVTTVDFDGGVHYTLICNFCEAT